MRNDWILTLDLGTTAVKACLFDGGLKLLRTHGQEYALETDGDRVEVCPQVYLDAVTACVQALGNLDAVGAVSLSTQGETLLAVDAAGKPLANAIVWLDSRAEAQAARLRTALEEADFYAHTGLPAVTGALPLCKAMWLRECRPEVWRRAKKLLLLEDYLLHWLTGRFATEKSLQTSTGWFRLDRDSYWAEALALAGIPQDLLPPALECGTIVGPVLPERAACLGLPERAVVVTGAMDQTAAALAAGCTEEGRLCETTGTAMVAAAYTTRPDFRDHRRVTVYRHVTQGAYLYLPISNTAGMALKWLRQACFPGQSYAQLDRLAEAAPAGAGGVLFLPYLSGAGDPDPLPEATACFWGLRLSATGGHLVRAVLEAVACQLRAFLEMLSEMGCPIGSVCSLGGGASSDLWMQIKADVCQFPLHRLATPQATSLGAAMLAAQALGHRPAPPEPAAVFAPNPALKETYEDVYRRSRRLWRAVKPLYERMD